MCSQNQLSDVHQQSLTVHTIKLFVLMCLYFKGIHSDDFYILVLYRMNEAVLVNPKVLIWLRLVILVSMIVDIS